MSPFAGLAGNYGCILADPPWRFATYSAKGRGRSPDGPVSSTNDAARLYDTMTLADIMALPVADLAARDCVLLMRAIDPMLPQALEVGKAWGFTFKTVGFYWAKEGKNTVAGQPDSKRFPIGTGYWTRANPEQCLLFTRGKPKRVSASVRKLIVSPRREHSRKPDEQYAAIEALVGGPYCELFSRSPRVGWSSWGLQTDRFPEVR